MLQWQALNRLSRKARHLTKVFTNISNSRTSYSRIDRSSSTFFWWFSGHGRPLIFQRAWKAAQICQSQLATVYKQLFPGYIYHVPDKKKMNRNSDNVLDLHYPDLCTHKLKAKMYSMLIITLLCRKLNYRSKGGTVVVEWNVRPFNSKIKKVKRRTSSICLAAIWI